MWNFQFYYCACCCSKAVFIVVISTSYFKEKNENKVDFTNIDWECSDITVSFTMYLGPAWNEWMNVYFVYRTHHIVSQGGLQFYLSEIGRELLRRLWLPLSVHIWSHPPTQPMHEIYNETMTLQIDHNTGNYVVFILHALWAISHWKCWLLKTLPTVNRKPYLLTVQIKAFQQYFWEIL